MQYSVETITPSSQHEMVSFLKEHDNSALFLLGNFENYGAHLTDAPYSGNFKLIRSKEQVVGVFCLMRNGNLLIETVLQESIFALVFEACHQEPMPLKGAIGNWNFCKPFWEYLKAKKVIQKEVFNPRKFFIALNCTNKIFYLSLM